MNALNNIPLECKLFTAEQSRSADQKTISDFGIDGFTLMEIAASGAAGLIQELQKNNKKGLFICGKGNNAGDALAVARYLINDAGHSAVIFPVFGTDDLSPDAFKNFELLKTLKKHGASVTLINKLEDADFSGFDYIVDGIFGTGLNSSLKEPLPAIIKAVNSSFVPVYSMDVPSGMNTDTGNIFGSCIKADHTFTFGTHKLGFCFDDASAYTGTVEFIKLPFPQYVVEESAVLINQHLFNALPQRTHSPKHKYDGGVVHIIAGSEGLTGAAIMAAKSSWKQGAGAVFLYCPKKLLPIYEVALPQIIKVAVGDDRDTRFKPEHCQSILSSLEKKKGTLLIGPGIGTHTETGNFVAGILSKYTGIAIIDADALQTWDELKSLPAEIKENWLLTPHSGEAVSYLHADYNNDPERYSWATAFSDKQSCNLLIKGNPAIFSPAGSVPFITGYDTSVFNRAGFGDVLAGAISANASLNGNLISGTLYALFETYITLSPSKEKYPYGPENLL